jgi:hypothetical protein
MRSRQVTGLSACTPVPSFASDVLPSESVRSASSASDPPCASPPFRCGGPRPPANSLGVTSAAADPLRDPLLLLAAEPTTSPACAGGSCGSFSASRSECGEHTRMLSSPPAAGCKSAHGLCTRHAVRNRCKSKQARAPDVVDTASFCRPLAPQRPILEATLLPCPATSRATDVHGQRSFLRASHSE